MRLGRLHFRVATRRREALRERFDAADCRACLIELERALAGHPWMVVAGLVEPLLRGNFSRGHCDVDIGVPLANVKDVARAAGAAGYVMTTRLMRSRLGPDRDLELYLQVDAGSHVLARRPRRLRLWRLNARGGLDDKRFPSYIDVFPYIASDKELRVLDGDWRLPVELPIVRHARLPEGVAVPVEDPSYVHAMHVLRTSSTRG